MENYKLFKLEGHIFILRRLSSFRHVRDILKRTLSSLHKSFNETFFSFILFFRRVKEWNAILIWGFISETGS
ncbi:unnamed protein product [Rhizophagus irregularis]|nr:unnamed protein product [Rhizophagus irregularis]CAB5391905.1 unnamed protein product [Rhizophagus irregularis]